MDHFDCLSDKTVTDLELSMLENKIQFTLPEDYKLFLKKQNGVKVKKSIFAVFLLAYVPKKAMFCRACSALIQN